MVFLKPMIVYLICGEDIIKLYFIKENFKKDFYLYNYLGKKLTNKVLKATINRNPQRKMMKDVFGFLRPKMLFWLLNQF